MVLRERVVDVRFPSDADIYTAPPIPFGAVHVVNEHPLPNVSVDPLPSDVLKTAPFPSLNDTLSTLSEVNDRIVPDAVVMSEEERFVVVSELDGVIEISDRFRLPEEREKRVHVREVGVSVNVMFVNNTDPPFTQNTTVPEFTFVTFFL